MIPDFPSFKNIELTDKEEVEKFTLNYQPYSDFNFISMWSWDIKREMGLSKLNNNLVVRFTDYITGKPFYSFLGSYKQNDTAEKLIELSKKEGLEPALKLMPEDSIKGLDKNKFKIKEDKDNFDYMYNILHLSSFKGRKYETHRNLVNQFLKKHDAWKVMVMNFNDIKHKNSILSLYKKWLKNKGESPTSQDYKNEYKAFKKLLLIDELTRHNIVCFVVYVEDKLIGFIVNEYVKDHNIIHFEKAHIEFKGAYPFLMQQNSNILKNFNLKYLNFEQDLGIDSLKFTKNKLGPSHFLKKYSVTL